MTNPVPATPLPSPLLLIPFLLQLLSIALLPFLAGHWWERHYPKVSATLGSDVTSRI